MTDGLETVDSLHGGVLYFTVVRFMDAGSQSRGCLITVCAEKGRKLRWAAAAVVLLVVVHVVLNRLVDFHSLAYFITGGLGIVYLLVGFVFSVYKESVLAIGSLGVQVSLTYWCGYTSTLFIPLTVISDVIINEAITMHRVIFYLALLIGQRKDSQFRVRKLIPLFTKLSPRLSTIETAYHHIREVLYSEHRLSL